MWSQCVVDGNCNSVVCVGAHKARDVTLKWQVASRMLSKLVPIYPLEREILKYIARLVQTHSNCVVMSTFKS